MVAYVGGKIKLSKYLKPYLENPLLLFSNHSKYYYEPFVGGCGSFVRPEGYSHYLGSDIRPYWVAFLNYLLEGNCNIPYCTKEEYYQVKENPENFPEWYVGFVSVLCSFQGKEWGGYATPKTRNYIEASIKSSLMLSDQLKSLPNVSFLNCSYEYVEPLPFSTVYCDPPYLGTTGYGVNFDHDGFWDWVRKISLKCYVLVSEYQAPKDFITVFEKERKNQLGLKNHSTRVEKLFVYSEGLITSSFF